MLAGFFHIFVRCNDPPMKNIRFGLCIPACLFALFCSQQASPQGYVKLNVPYALVGVVNPAVEFAISPKSTLQTDIVISPWKSINEKHMLFAIFMGEYRRYFKEHNRGWYLGANIGMMAFDMSKPCIENWKLKFGNCYCKGYGMTIGLCVNCEYRFAGRWLLAAYFGRSGWTAATTAIRTTAGSIHTAPSSRITQIPRPIRQLLGEASQQDRSLSRLPPPTTNRLTPASGDYSRGRTRSVP